jgi:hypothetical protein
MWPPARGIPGGVGGLGGNGDARGELLEEESRDSNSDNPELGGGSRNRLLARK